MNKVLVVVDVQNDFVDGALGTPEAQAIIPNVVKKIEEYKTREDLIITTQDTHYSNYLNTMEGKNLPIIHCIANSDGWQLEDNVFDSLRYYANKINFTKCSFGSEKLKNYLKTIINDDNESEYEIEIIGLVLDICVITNAIILKTCFPNTTISVNLNCTAATNKNNFENARSILDSCQVKIYE